VVIDWPEPANASTRTELTSSAIEQDIPREECGVFGVWAPGEEVAKLSFYGIFALQHRGQEAAGIAVGDGSFESDHSTESQCVTAAPPSYDERSKECSETALAFQRFRTASAPKRGYFWLYRPLVARPDSNATFCTL
jgi:hypothetical protein